MQNFEKLSPTAIELFLAQMKSKGGLFQVFAQKLNEKEFSYEIELDIDFEEKFALDFSACPALPPICNHLELYESNIEKTINSDCSHILFFSDFTDSKGGNLDFLANNHVQVMKHGDNFFYLVEKSKAKAKIISIFMEILYSPVLAVWVKDLDFSMDDASIVSATVNIFDDEASVYIH